MVTFARPAGILDRPRKKRDSWLSWPDELDRPLSLGPKAEPVEAVLPFAPVDAGWKVFSLTTLDREVCRLDGYGEWLLNDIISDAIKAHRANPYLRSARADQVVWDGDRVVAIIRPLADGALDVVRFPASGPLPLSTWTGNDRGLVDDADSIINPRFTPAQRAILLDLINRTPVMTLGQIQLEFEQRTGRTVSKTRIHQLRNTPLVDAAEKGGDR